MFTITEDHIKLIQHLEIIWWDCEFGAPAVDPKRPYGNSDVEEDIAHILGWELLTTEQNIEARIEANKLHKELKQVLQIVLCTKSFQPGKYVKENDYSDKSWKLLP